MGIEPTHSHLRYDAHQLSNQAPESKMVGRKGIQALILGVQYINFSCGTPLGDDTVTYGTWLDALIIRPNSSNNHK